MIVSHFKVTYSSYICQQVKNILLTVKTTLHLKQIGSHLTLFISLSAKTERLCFFSNVNNYLTFRYAV